MLNIGIITLLVIDALLLTIGKFVFYYKAYKVIDFNLLFNRMKTIMTPESEEEDSDDTDEIVEPSEKDKNIFAKCLQYLTKILLLILKLIVALLLIVLGILIIALCLAVTTASVWGTLLIGIYYSALYAIIFLFGLRILYFLLGYWMFKKTGVPRERTQRVLIMDVIQFTMLSILIFFVLFDYNVEFVNVVTSSFQWSIGLNNLASIGLPMVFYALIFTNILALFVRFGNIMTKDYNKHKILRLHQILLIFIGSCYFGILYITDMELSFMNDLQRGMYLQTLEVVKWIVTSVFIPLFLYTLNNYKKPKKTVRNVRKRTSGRI